MHIVILIVLILLLLFEINSNIKEGTEYLKESIFSQKNINEKLQKIKEMDIVN